MLFLKIDSFFFFIQDGLITNDTHRDAIDMAVATHASRDDDEDADAIDVDSLPMNDVPVRIG